MFGDYINTCLISRGVWTWTKQTNSGKKEWHKISCSETGSAILANEKWTSNLFVSTDFGETWIQRNVDGLPVNYQIGALWVSATGKFFVGSSNAYGLFRSNNYGQEWIHCWPKFSQEVYWKEITTSADGEVVYAIAEQGYMFYSLDGAQGVIDSSDDDILEDVWLENAPRANIITCSATGQTVIASKWEGTAEISENFGVDWVERSSSGNKNGLLSPVRQMLTRFSQLTEKIKLAFHWILGFPG